MKKLLFVLIALIVGGARADNVVTSREYVDAQANTLQTELPAKNTNTVLLNTDTAGEVGEKAIYDASAAFGTQTDTLVTAGQFNTAVQNALESEFVCIERQNGNGGCLLYEIRAATPITTNKIANGYTQLEYLESTGTQWIDTNYKPNNLTNFEIKYLHTTFVSSGIANVPYGCTNQPDASRAMYGLFRTSPGSDTYIRVAWGDDTTGSNKDLVSNYFAQPNVWYTDKYLQNKIYINGELVATSATSPTTPWTASQYLRLFARGSVRDPFPSAIKLMYAKAWENNQLKFNLLPARRDSDGTLGMYDTVTNTFFTNAGTGEFVAGPVVSSNLYLPSGNQ